LQQYADQKLPPRIDILIKLARGANVSIDWLATGQGENEGRRTAARRDVRRCGYGSNCARSML
jgi:hypothetical protein